MITILNKYCRMSGRSVTKQRKVLFGLIRQTKGHLDADELFHRAKEKEARISLATVYRNLKLFKEIGLISESNLGEAHAHYERRGATEHHHLICRHCGRVVEFDSPLIAQTRERIEREKGFDIVSTQIRMEGYCPKCRHRKS